jgi:hypothetical protein
VLTPYVRRQSDPVPWRGVADRVISTISARVLIGQIAVAAANPSRASSPSVATALLISLRGSDLPLALTGLPCASAVWCSLFKTQLKVT